MAVGTIRSNRPSIVAPGRSIAARYTSHIAWGSAGAGDGFRYSI
jgi:hypothetical protein